ncbi:hypothetical protein KNT58_gp57 [Mycobacterium phage Fortunato]|uniref:Uncharacterized protein n=1 Tax=Mycobacterium phage Fortunato TaxID=1882439 RepID=A0A1D8EYF8_9CAUD|nr:hypothetical protein KNT58_gp57 [Mycobacterium phage Fortunato]AOT27274.1 hypothetical protein SEA_FORTUNATO_57 [Mycobacterium phage Fortunato]
MTIGFIEGPVTGTTDIDWLSSTTTTRVRRTKRQEPQTSVEHVARFGIRPESVPDSPAEFSRTAVFRPEFMQVRWDDGFLKSVTMSGPLRLKNGGVSEKVNRKREWREYGSKTLDKAQLPAQVAAALTAYEQAVAGVAANGGDPE